MENPYSPPAGEVQHQERTWIQTGFAIVSGCLSLLIFAGIASNTMIFAGLKTWPNTAWQWLGIVAMTGVMLMSSIGFALVSIGLMRSAARFWKRGLWIVAISVVGYILLAGLSLVMRTMP